MSSAVLQNTLGVPSQADRVFHVDVFDDLRRYREILRSDHPVVLGGGSNVILAQKIERPVFLIRNRGIAARAVQGAVEVTVAAGELWHNLVRWTLGCGLAGLENLSLIPGRVGAAPIQNIGAYGAELANVLVRLETFDRSTGKPLILDRDECEFGYRTSLFKRQRGRFVIGSITLRLNPGAAPVRTDYPDLRLELERLGITNPGPVQVAEAVIRVRRRKLPDPRRVPNAGSFFKNPVVDRTRFQALQEVHQVLRALPDASGVKLAAAQLIELSGQKSVSEHGLRVWRRQPLVLTNPTHRSGSEILEFANGIRAAVEQFCGIRLELEPDTIGFEESFG